VQVEAQQFGPEALSAIFAEAEQMEKVKPGTPEAKVGCYLLCYKVAAML
jgi:hypothetical protein